MIRYALKANETIAGKDCYIARVYSTGTIDQETFFEEVLASDPSIDRSMALAFLKASRQTLLRYLLDGYTVHTSTAIYSLQIKGKFEGCKDQFDPRRHDLSPRARPASDLTKDLEHEARLTKIEAPDLRPNLFSFEDVCSKQCNAVLTPGGIGHLTGYRLKLDLADPDQGVFFLDANNRVVRVKTVAENLPGSLMFLIPPLSLGVYRLALRAGHSEKGPETVFLQDILSVVSTGPLLEEPADALPHQPFLLPGTTE